MNRNADWTPIRPCDPVPGDPDELDRAAAGCTNTAAELRDQAARLRALAGDHGWDSEAGSLWRVRAREIAGQLERVVERYSETGKALDTYAGVLSQAQRSADRAREDGQQAHHEEQRLQTTIRQQTQDGAASSCAPPLDASGLTSAADEAHARYVAADQAIARAERQRDMAAEEAARKIEHNMADDGLNDSGWDRAKSWITKHAEGIKKIAEVAGWVATGLGIAALVLGFIPVVGPLAAVVLGGLAAFATAVSLLCNLALAASGNGSWFDVGLDVVSLLTIGIGRAALTGVKTGAKATRAMATVERSKELAASNLARRTAAGKTLSRHVVRGVRRSAERQARRELGMNAHDVKAALTHPPRVLPRAAEVGRALNPVSMIRESSDAAKALSGSDAWKEFWKALTAGRVGPGLVDEATRRVLADLRDLPTGVRDLPDVRAAATATRGGVVVFLGSTALALSLDVGNKHKVFEPYKPRLEHEL